MSDEFDDIRKEGKETLSFIEEEYGRFFHQNISPKPGFLAINDPIVKKNELFIQIDDNLFTKDNSGNYIIKIDTTMYEEESEQAIKLDLLFKPIKRKALRQGYDGYVKDTQTFYYSLTNLKIFGKIQINNQMIEIVNDIKNKGWYDHEFDPNQQVGRLNQGWNWISIQLDNNVEICCSLLSIDHEKNANDQIIVTDAAPLNDDNNSMRVIHEKDNKIMINESNGNLFVSHKSFNSYPTKFKIELDDIKYGHIELEVECALNSADINCEIIFIPLRNTFWESPVNISGYINDGQTKVNGVGFVEMVNAADYKHVFNEKMIMKKMQSYLADVAIHSIYPKVNNFNFQHLKKLMLLPGFEGKTNYNELDLNKVHLNLLNPVLQLIKQKGKGWRSLGGIVAANIANNNFNPTQMLLKQLTALQELTHVGSLILDDIQDHSSQRRGMASVHIGYDIKTAINCGNAAMMLSEYLFRDIGVNEDQKLRMYQQLFRCYRGAWIGQSLDCATLDYMMEDVIDNKNNEVDLAIDRLTQIHSLKTGVPVSVGACLDAIVADENITDDTLNVLANYFENLGISFQILDDVKNLMGVFRIDDTNNDEAIPLKNIGEDITEAKVTYPLLYAMKFIKNKKDKLELWKRIKRNPTDFDDIKSIINIIQDCGAIQHCKDIALQKMEKENEKIYQVFGPSFYTILLVAFGKFLLNN